VYIIVHRKAQYKQTTMAEIPELEKQNAKFGYKAPESVYKKHDPKASLVGSGMWHLN
jgi:hypothetical protein